VHFDFSFFAGIPLWFGLCSLEEAGQEETFLEWMLEQAYAANPDFCPGAFMLDKAHCEHKAVEAVLLRRAKAGLDDFLKRLPSADHTVTPAQVRQAELYLKQHQSREEHLQRLATGVTR